jgi:Wax ester synthase-like Acyl-CoA acyltransferase domain/WS/DGAT C-terminal domain
VILDPDPKGTEIEASPKEWDPQEPRADRLVMEALSSRVRHPVKVARRAARQALNPTEIATNALRTADSFAQLARGGPTAPRTFLNQEIGRGRRRGFATETLEELKCAPETVGATVNDVVLSVATGALRRWFERRDERVPERIVALVPMSIRRPDEELELGNRIATLLVPLPIAETDPIARLREINETTTRPPGPGLPARPQAGRGVPVRAAVAAGTRASDRRAELRRRRLLRARRRSRRGQRHRRARRRDEGRPRRAGRCV